MTISASANLPSAQGTWPDRVAVWRSAGATEPSELFFGRMLCLLDCDTEDDSLRLAIMLSPMAYPCPQRGYVDYGYFWFALMHLRPDRIVKSTYMYWQELNRYWPEAKLSEHRSKTDAWLQLSLLRAQFYGLCRFFAQLLFGALLFVFLLGSAVTLALTGPRRHSPCPPPDTFQIPCGLARHTSPVVPRAPGMTRPLFDFRLGGTLSRVASGEALSPA